MIRKLLHVTTVFTVLSIVASGLNFLYYPLIARLLTYAQFGEVQVGTAFIMQAAALFTSLNILALFFAAQKEDLTFLSSRIERFVIVISLVLAALVSIFAYPIAAGLQLADPRLLYILSIIFLINIPGATWLGAIQGNGQFLASGIISCLSAFTKLVAGAIFIKLGFGAYGALLGLLLGTFLILPLSYMFQSGKLISFRKTFSSPQRHDFTLFKDHPGVLVIFVTLFILAIASTVDVITAKAALDPSSAGKYAQLSTAGKIPYFAALPLTILFFERFIKKPERTGKLLSVFIAFLALAALTTLTLQHLIIGVFFGTHTYDGIAFTFLGLSFSLYSLTTLLTYRLLARASRWEAAAVGVVALGAPLAFLSLFHDSSRSLAQSYFSGEALAVLVAIIMQYTRRNAEE